jgi:hypothetical protein
MSQASRITIYRESVFSSVMAKAFHCQAAAAPLPAQLFSRRMRIVSKKELGGPRNYAPRTSTGWLHTTRMAMCPAFSADRPLLKAQHTLQRSGAKGGPKKVDDPSTWPHHFLSLHVLGSHKVLETFTKPNRTKCAGAIMLPDPQL